MSPAGVVHEPQRADFPTAAQYPAVGGTTPPLGGWTGSSLATPQPWSAPPGVGAISLGEMLQASREASLDLGDEHAACPCTERDDRWVDVEATRPGRPLGELGVDDRLGCGDLGLPRLHVLRDLLLEVVDVVDVHVVELVDVGIDVARHRDVDEKERLALALLHHALHEVARDHERLAGGARDDDVRDHELGLELIERRGGAPERGREGGGALEAAVADPDRS